MEHAQIFYDNWKDGYDKSQDKDFDDYNDNWELNVANLEMDNSDFPVKPHIRFTDHEEDPGKDSYGPYDPDKLFLNPTWSGHTAGSEYEEWRCRLKEYNLFSQLNAIDAQDWSYDPPVTNGDSNLRTQGKQW